MIDIRTKKPSAMRRIAMATAVATLLVAHAPIASAQPVQGRPAAADMRPIVVGLGAIAGVVAFNVLALGVEALPGGMAYAAGATVPAEMSVAMSRVYATTAAVVGAWIGYYGFGR